MSKSLTSLKDRINLGHRHLLIVVMLLLVALLTVSYFESPVGDFMLFRSLRVVVSGLVLFYFLFNNVKQLTTLLFLLSYTASSWVIIWFEDVICGQMAMILSGFSFLVLIVELYKKINFRAISKLFYTFLLIGATLYATLLIELLKMLSNNIDDTLLKWLISISTSLSFILGIIVLCYNHIVNTTKTLLFTFFYIFLVFAEIFRAIGYFGFVDEIQGQYMARTLLVICFVFFLFYLEKSEQNEIPMTKIKTKGRI